MSTAVKTPPEPNVRDLVGGILQDAETLLGQQLEMFKAEVRADLERTARASCLFGVGLGVCLTGVILLAFTAVYLLAEAAPGLSLGACFGIVTVVVVGIGAALLAWAVQLFRSFNPLPNESAAALQENVECLTHPEECLTHPKMTTGGWN